MTLDQWEQEYKARKAKENALLERSKGVTFSEEGVTLNEKLVSWDDLRAILIASSERCEEGSKAWSDLIQAGYYYMEAVKRGRDDSSVA